MPDTPVLVISGDLDASTPSSAGRQVAGLIADATFAEIPNAGHVPTDASPCALKLGVRFVATTSAAGAACAGTGAPPPVTPRAPAADLAVAKTQITGALRLTGRVTPHGRLSVRPTGTGAGAATGTLHRRPVHLTFRAGG
jgi:hypothetical protein